MHIGLKNRLRVISLLPILILFSITGYYAYESFINYKATQLIKDRLSENRQLNGLLDSISLERGISIMYLGNSSPNTLKSLKSQRKIVDDKFKSYIKNTENISGLHDHSHGKSNCETCSYIDSLSKSIKKINNVRVLVNEQKTSFKEVYEEVYGSFEHNAVLQLENIAKNKIDNDISELSSAYISLVHAKAVADSERDLVLLTLTRSTQLTSKELNSLISTIAKSNLISYNSMNNNSLIEKLDILQMRPQVYMRQNLILGLNCC